MLKYADMQGTKEDFKDKKKELQAMGGQGPRFHDAANTVTAHKDPAATKANIAGRESKGR